MSSMSMFVSFNKEKKDSILLSLNKDLEGSILEVSDILSIIVYHAENSNSSKIEALEGVISVTDRKGKKIEVES